MTALTLWHSWQHNGPEPQLSAVLLTPVGLQFVGQPPAPTVWIDVVAQVYSGYARFKWALADAICLSEDLGEAYQAAVYALPLELGAIYNLTYTARNVSNRVRREGLSWAHHTEVAPLAQHPCGEIFQHCWLGIAEGHYGLPGPDGIGHTFEQVSEDVHWPPILMPPEGLTRDELREALRHWREVTGICPPKGFEGTSALLSEFTAPIAEPPDPIVIIPPSGNGDRYALPEPLTQILLDGTYPALGVVKELFRLFKSGELSQEDTVEVVIRRQMDGT